MLPLLLALTLLQPLHFYVVTAQVQRCQLRLAGDAQVPLGGDGSGNSPTSTTSSGGSTTTSSSLPSPTPFDYGSTPIRGVNLGGWLVLEPWITPSIFENTGDDDIVDEYTFGQMQDRDTALEVLERHWDTWITEDDFIQIKAAGLNHVRIPLGYWSVPLTSADTNQSTSPDPYIPGAWPYLLRGLNWARTHGLRVIIDIHGAPGSQNGYDNSGQRTGNPQWAYNESYVERTIDTVRYIVEHVGGMLDIIELLNEPAGFYSDEFTANTRQYFQDGYDMVRETVGDDIQIMIGDAFRGVNSWQGFLTAPEAHGVLMDYHQYQIFSNAELNRTLDEHVKFACTNLAPLRTYASSNLWTIVGEWSNAATDCTKWLNGRGIGARWDGTRQQDDMHVFGSCDGWSGNYSTFSDDYKTFLRRYWEVQVEMGEDVQGWVFWTWKAENSDEWSYQKGLEGGWIPRDPSNREYPNICSS